ncbi:MAG: UPF0182 family protein [Clostridiales bacterium]|nr:UPF0182 family protein [Clostridiales bacterium]
MKIKENFKRKLYILLTVLLILLVFSKSIVNFITNYIWFKNVGFLSVFTVQVITKLILFIPIIVFIFIGMKIYLNRLSRKYIKLGQVILTEKQIANNKKIFMWFSLIISSYVSLITTQDLWFKTLQFINRTSFNQMDPIFNKDISFYVFTLPFLHSLLISAITIVAIFIVVTLLFYIAMMRLYPPAEGSLYDFNEITSRPNFKSIFRKELAQYGLRKVAVFGFLFFVFLSYYFYLKGFYLMYSARGVAYGASYTDINVTLLGYRIITIISLIGAPIFSYSILKNKKILMLVAPVSILIMILGMSGIAIFVQQLVVEPDEITKEKEFLEYNIFHTQYGFNLQNVETVDYEVKQSITYEDILSNSETISNIRINDARPLKQTFNQIQVIRLYYDFNDVDIDRYNINGKYTEVFISARELNPEKLIDSAQTWINMHLKYTHGYGIVMAPVNKVTNEGQPELIFKNIPPITTTGLVINQPEIYFGELANGYIIVNSKEKEFDYPSGSDNKETMYSGTAGITLGAVNRTLFSIRENSMKLLFSTNITNESKIIINRNIKDRVNKLAPFIIFDENPYIVLDEITGRLYWIIDGYSVTNQYPYSQTYSFNGFPTNYIRNSVKAVVDAYNGDVSFYVYDVEDPLIKTYSKIFEGVFKNKALMPDSLKNHVKYPQDYFDLQGEVYREYHVVNPMVFYNGEDVWDISNEKFMENIQKIESNYVMFKLPEEDKAEFSVILPYTPREKPNMASLLVGRSDYENYGKLLIYRLPKDKTIDGPMMIESRIDQDSTISPQFTLWGQEGSSVLRGNVIVVPIDGSLLYVEPIYIQADNKNSIPEMKRVIIAYENKIVMENNLEDALKVLFNQSIEENQVEYNTDNTVLNELLRRYNELKNYVDELETIINELIDQYE